MGRASANRRRTILDEFKAGLGYGPGERTDMVSTVYLPLTLHSGRTIVIRSGAVDAYEELEQHCPVDGSTTYERSTARTRVYLSSGTTWEVRQSIQTIRKALEVP